MSKHTPRPWIVEDIGKKAVRINAKDWTGFAKVFVVVNGERDHEGESNARLIAASPRLLNALKSVVAEMKDCCDDLSVWEFWDEVNAAIEEATGESA